ncbi:hypothetical protein HYR53_10735 [Candidatus Acetothermia bacterium]|nr:hypothetical protein [Candidatus Acetothermia bacterium]
MKHSVLGLLPLLILLVCGLTTLAAFGKTGALQAYPHVTIVAHDFSFDVPQQISAGLTLFELQNRGIEPHHAQIAKMKDGVTMAQIQTAIKQSPDAAIQLLQFVGGPSTVAPGNSQRVLLNLDPGQYVLLCFVSGADGVPHLAKGMIAQFSVAISTQGSMLKEPDADLSVNLNDFSFDMPGEIPASAHIWKVTNQGAQPHEMPVLKLAPGASIESVMKFMQDPKGFPPFDVIGGIQAMDSGKSGYAVLDLKPGSYVVVCFVPDPHTGKSHLELGMFKPFTVVEASQPGQPAETNTGGGFPRGLLAPIIALCLALILILVLRH